MASKYLVDGTYSVSLFKSPMRTEPKGLAVTLRGCDARRVTVVWAAVCDATHYYTSQRTTEERERKDKARGLGNDDSLREDRRKPGSSS